MKKFAVALVILLAVAVAALLALPSFWDWNGEKGRMAALVKEHTGRDLQIAGDVSLRLLPSPAFSAEQVTLANLEGGSEPAMVRLEELTVSIALLPLLRGEVLVESVTLVQPEVLLEVLEDGRANWRLADAPPAATASPGAPGGRAESGATQPIRIDSFLIEDGRVRYRDARSGIEETLQGLDAELAADSLLGPFAASGSAVYRDVPVAFDLSLGPLVEGGATAASLSLQLPRAGASASFVGALSRHEGLETLRGRLQAEGGDLAQVLAAVGLAEAMPAPFARPFSLGAELSASQTEAAAEALKVTLGPLSLDGRVAADLRGEPAITARLSTKAVDLDALLAPAAGGEAAAEAAAGTAGAPGSGAPAEGVSAAPLGLPRGFSAELELSADALLYRGQPLRQLQVSARLADGRLEIAKADVLLPGSSDLQLAGTVSDDGAGLRFAGTLSAESDNLRGLLRWLDSNPEGVPAQRLRRLVLRTDVEASADRLVLRDTDLRLDVSRLTGGAAIALRDRPGLGLALNIDKVNLDAYLPPPDGAAATPQAPAEPGAGTPPPVDPAVVAPPLGVPLLGRFDANLDLRVGQLTWRGLPLDGLRLDATLQRGGVVVREFSVADLVGSRGRFSGSIANVDRAPSVDGSLDVSVSTLSRLVKALGVPTAGPLPLESFTLSGAINGTRDDLRFDQRLAALGGTLRASGRALLPEGAPQVEAALALDHPDLSVLLRELLRDPAVPSGLGAAAVEGHLAAGVDAVSLSELKGRLAGIELLDGRLTAALAGPRPKLTADIEAGQLPLAALFAPAAAKKSGSDGRSAQPRAPSGAASERWSRKPLDLAALRAVDAEVKLRAKALQAEKLHLANAVLEASLTDGLLELKRFAADSYGGALTVTGRADARDAAAGLQVAADVKADKVELKGLLQDLADSDRFSGPVTLESRLATRGASEAALVSGLSGAGSLTGTVTVAAKVEEQAGALLLGILGQKVREVRGVSDSTTVLFGAFAGAPAAVDGTFKMEEGVARSEDLTVRGRNAVAQTKGTIDLPAWQLDSTTQVFRDADPRNAYLTARLQGPLDGPDVAIGGQPFQRQQAPAEQPSGAEAPAVQEQPQEQPQQPQKGPVKPEELLKDGLKNLLKGLGG